MVRPWLFLVWSNIAIILHGKEVVGYELVIEGLTADESVAIQTTGLGGRRHMGCGVFVPHLQAEVR